MFSGTILGGLGRFLVFDEDSVPSDAVIVLNTGVEYSPRLIEAARLFRDGFARKVVINGNRKTDVLRGLEKRGFKRCCTWYEDSLRILSLYGVSRDKVVYISAEDAYDTVTEAEAVGKELLKKGFTRIIITTSKYHTRRARYIWKKMYGGKLAICSVSAKTDPYDPRGWWRQGRQVRWVLAEYGAWVYYY
ncbi:MAG: YdcF family protein, partial [Deltaproteobacteria bacterium]|nr:YdcF family protein [Deltaproteobacteria bacterium]